MPTIKVYRPGSNVPEILHLTPEEIAQGKKRQIEQQRIFSDMQHSATHGFQDVATETEILQQELAKTRRELVCLPRNTQEKQVWLE